MDIFERLHSGEAVPNNDPGFSTIFKIVTQTKKLSVEMNTSTDFSLVRKLLGEITGIEALKNWYSKIGTPVTLAEGNIPEADIPMLVDKLSVVAKMWGAEALYSKDMIRTVLENAR